MNEMLYMLLVFIGGILLGVIFFGGLWLTVKRGMSSKMPGLLFMGSFFIRTGIILVGFYELASDNLRNMAVCLVGFILARLIVKHFTKQQNTKKGFGKELSHEA